MGTLGFWSMYAAIAACLQKKRIPLVNFCIQSLSEFQWIFPPPTRRLMPNVSCYHRQVCLHRQVWIYKQVCQLF